MNEEVQETEFISCYSDAAADDSQLNLALHTAVARENNV